MIAPGRDLFELCCGCLKGHEDIVALPEVYRTLGESRQCRIDHQFPGPLAELEVERVRGGVSNQVSGSDIDNGAESLPQSPHETRERLLLLFGVTVLELGEGPLGHNKDCMAVLGH